MLFVAMATSHAILQRFFLNQVIQVLHFKYDAMNQLWQGTKIAKIDIKIAKLAKFG